MDVSIYIILYTYTRTHIAQISAFTLVGWRRAAVHRVRLMSSRFRFTNHLIVHLEDVYLYIIGIYIYCNRYNARSRSCYFGFFSQQYINVYRFFTNRPSRNRKTIATKLSRIRTWFFWLGFFLLTTAFCR